MSSTLDARPDDTQSHRSTRGWLQRSQSHNEVNNDTVGDRGRCQISEMNLLRDNVRNYFC